MSAGTAAPGGILCIQSEILRASVIYPDMILDILEAILTFKILQRVPLSGENGR
jgi:hypothetical protein